MTGQRTVTTATNPATIFRAWTRATLAGWLLGIPSVVAFALVGELIGLGGRQIWVGAGMGFALGILQGRLMGRLIGAGMPWFWSCLGGAALAFAGADLAKARGVSTPYVIQVAMVGCGLVSGARQAVILRVSELSWSWLLASVAGWTAAAFAVAAADLLPRVEALRGLPGALAYLGLVSAGGLLLGMITASTLVRLLAARESAGT